MQWYQEQLLHQLTYLYNSINNVKYIVTDDNIDHPIQTFNHNQIEKIASKIYYENS